MTIKCVRVIVDNFERLPAHDATSGLYICSHNGAEHGSRSQDETKDGVGEGDAVTEADAVVAGQSDAVGGDGGGGGGGGAAAGAGEGEAKLEEDEHGEAGQQKERQRERRVIPAKFLQLISAGLSTDLDPKVWIAFFTCTWEEYKAWLTVCSRTCVWLVVVLVAQREKCCRFYSE